ncbi:MAG: hypothetical protein AAF996_16760 [Pseudomonadota bacterium]
MSSLTIVSGEKEYRGNELARAYNGYVSHRYDLYGGGFTGAITFTDDAMTIYAMTIDRPSGLFAVEVIDLVNLKRIAAEHYGEHYTQVDERLMRADAGFQLWKTAVSNQSLGNLVGDAESGWIAPFHQFHDANVEHFDENKDFSFVRLAEVKPGMSPRPSVGVTDLASIEDLSRSLEESRSKLEGLIRSLDERIAANDAAIDETAALGRAALNCDLLADTVFSNTGDPENGDDFNADAVKYMPLEVFGYVDDCAEFQHARLNFIAGVGRLTGLPLGYFSDAEAFDYFISASKYGYPYGATAAGAVLSNEAPEDWLTEERFSALMTEYEAQGKNVDELRHLGNEYIQILEEKKVVGARLEEAKARLAEFEAQLKQKCASVKRNRASARLSQSDRTACGKVGVQFP